MAENSLSILTYHAIDQRQSIISLTPEKFHWQMEALARHKLKGISLAGAFEHFSQAGRFPERSVVLTFDDGYRSVFEQALPVMSTLGFSGTAFIPTDFIGMSAEQAQRRQPDLDRDMMNWRHLETLQQSGFEIGAHSMSHADLTRTPMAVTQRELVAAGQCLEQRIGRPVRSFAYPFGRYNQQVRSVAAQHYKYACTTELGHNRPACDRLLLKRLDVYFLRHEQLFIRACEGGFGAYWQARQALRNLKASIG